MSVSFASGTVSPPQNLIRDIDVFLHPEKLASLNPSLAFLLCTKQEKPLPLPPSLKHHPESFRSANNEASAGTHPGKYNHICVGMYKMCLAQTPAKNKPYQCPLIL